MKSRNIFILTALIFTVFCIGACGPWDGSDNQSSIIINFGNAGARYAVSDDDKAEMIYSITLNCPGKAAIETKTTKGAESISIPVSEGAWNIKVKAKGDGRRIAKGEGETNVAVAAGKPAPVYIAMKVTGTRVSTWAELKEDFDELNKADGKLNDLEEIEIIATELEVSATETSDALTFKTEKTITLWSEMDVTIMRSEQKRQNGGKEVNATVFTISKGTFILESRNGGIITIDGNKNNIDSCIRALINVEDNGTLILNDRITLTNNKTQFGGAVHVSKGYFYMYGGIISNNIASDLGGGVCIRDNGHFEKTGGTIYGSESEMDDTLRNIAYIDGDAVNVNGTAWDNTLGIDVPWPIPKS